VSNIELGLSDEEFWGKDPARDSRLDDRLYRAGLRGTLIGAPSRVPLGARETLPLMVARVASFQDAARTDFAELAVVTALDLETNELRAGMLVERPDNYEPPAKLPVPENLGTGHVSRIHHAELRRQLALAWRPSSLLVGLVVRDSSSNRVRVELSPSDQSYRDPEVERFLAAEAERNVAPLPWPPPGEPLPCYQAIEGSPEVPVGPSIALAGDRVVVADERARLVLCGSFRLPLVRREIVPVVARPAEPLPSAVLAVSLLVVGADLALPTVVPLRVPVWDESPTVGALVTGHFALDLLALPVMPRVAQTYFVYAFRGEAMAGPLPMALVDPSMLVGSPP
jgi:hypothetical protein